jgi:hypothetical protein
MIPRIVIAKGNIIRIGREIGISQEAWGLEVRLQKDCDNRQGKGYLDDAHILVNPNGWPRPTVNHTLRTNDLLLTSKSMVNADVVSLLQSD